MSTVSYNGSKLIPAPFVSITKSYQKTGDGNNVGKTFNITINGTIVAFRGSPNSSGIFHTSSGQPADEVVNDESRLAAILRKQEAIRQLFAQEGKSFEVQSLDGSQPMKCNPRIIDIDFPEGQWYNTSPYTIVLEADELYPKQEDNFNNQYISSAEENWQIETNEDQPEGLDAPRTYRLTHTVSAVGKRFYDDTGTLVKPAWFHARDYVVSRLGFDTDIALSSGVINLPSYYGGFNHFRSQDVDEAGGTFSVTESWFISSGTAIEDFDIQKTTNIDSDITIVTINGTVTGLEERSADLKTINNTKYANAVTKFNLASGLSFSRAQTYSGETLNINPISTAIGRNPITGIINYTFEYDTRPDNIVPGAKSEIISINDGLKGDMFASVFVLGRNAGPVLQNLNTTPSLTRNLNLELVMGKADFGSKSEADLRTAFNNNPRLNPATSGAVGKIIDAADPKKAGFTVVFKNQPQETWEPKTGRYSLSIGWTRENE